MSSPRKLRPLSRHEQEYLRYSLFIGELLRDGLMEQAEASALLVQAYWDKERALASDEGIDLDAQVREWHARHPETSAAGA